MYLLFMFSGVSTNKRLLCFCALDLSRIVVVVDRSEWLCNSCENGFASNVQLLHRRAFDR